MATPAPPMQYPSAGPAPVREMPADLVHMEESKDKTMPIVNPLPNPQMVTPLHLLSEGQQWIDCPFCERRAQVWAASVGTTMQTVCGALLCIFCICLTCVPCLAGWFENIEYRCRNCKQMVALRPYEGPMQTFGPQSRQTQVPSQFCPAPTAGPKHVDA